MSYKRSSILAEEISDYLQFRRAGGAKFEKEYVFDNFDAHMASRHYESKILDREIVMSFCSLKEGERITNLANRVTNIRGFLNYLANVRKYEGTFNDIPTVSARNCSKYIPYIFTEEEIDKILNEAHHHKIGYAKNTCPNILNVIPAILETLYCTGMRLGEAINLKVEDVDIDQGIIYIREAKNYNKRIVAMSDSLKEEVTRYCKESEKFELSGVYFFDVGLPRNQGQLSKDIVYRYFRRIIKNVGIEHKGKGYGPRVHDLRHTFCCHSLKKLSQMDGDINAYIVYLCTYMGHKSLRETQKYIWLTSDLFKDTLDKLEDYTDFISDLYEDSLHEEHV